LRQQLASHLVLHAELLLLCCWLLLLLLLLLLLHPPLLVHASTLVVLPIALPLFVQPALLLAAPALLGLLHGTSPCFFLRQALLFAFPAAPVVLLLLLPL